MEKTNLTKCSGSFRATQHRYEPTPGKLATTVTCINILNESRSKEIPMLLLDFDRAFKTWRTGFVTVHAAFLGLSPEDINFLEYGMLPDDWQRLNLRNDT